VLRSLERAFSYLIPVNHYLYHGDPDLPSMSMAPA